MKLTTGQVKTTPVPFKPAKKPENIATKKPIKVVKKVKVARNSLPNIKGTEGAAKAKGGMNDENALRKQRRLNQGL